MVIQDKTARNTSFSRSVIAGLICGIIAAVLNAVYDYFFRNATGFDKDKLISPLVIFSAVPIILIIAGVIFFEMAEFMKRGRLIFTTLFLVIMLVAIAIDLTVRGNSNSLPRTNGLLLGMEIVTGLIIAFLLPFLATHPWIFMENEELSESSAEGKDFNF